MSLVSSMYTGASGLQTLSTSIEVISNNISNVNTVGFKAGRAEFQDLLSQSLGDSQVGRGVTLDAISSTFAQGSFQNTSISTDLAISGEGFFILSDGISEYYSRAGEFRFNAEGTLVNPNGLLVQGYQYDNNGNNLGVVGEINFANLSSTPKMTETITVGQNLDATGDTNVFDAADPVNTSNFSTTVTVYDSLGSSHTVTVYYNKTGDNTWEWNATVDPDEVTTALVDPDDLVIEGGSGTLIFNEDGSLQNTEAIPPTGATVAPSATFDFAGGATANQTIAFNFGTPTLADLSGGTGLDGTTQFASDSVINFQSQDGYPTGNLQGLEIDQDGVVTGIFSNGRSREIAQIAIATFTNNNGLKKSGGNLYLSTIASGDATVTQPNTGAAGAISSNTLELSNVDLTNEFVNMITTQRGFQASSRVISTSDEMLNEIVNLGR